MTDVDRNHVLVAGVTTRALALSAARAGYRVTAVDAFGDLDLRASAEVIALRSDLGAPYSPMAAAAAAPSGANLVTYTSNFENYPRAVASLAAGRQLLGNPPEVLLRVRHPTDLMRTLRRRGFATPETRTKPMSGPGRGPWLLKPRRSGGGHGITVWQPGRPIPRTSYLQERIDGAPGSIAFAADGTKAIPLGLTRQLVGDAHFGADGFRYCGSLLGAPARLYPGQEQLFDVAASLAAGVTAEFGLVGLNGLDFIAQDGVPYPIEVNPRFSGSMELLERAHGLSMFEIHESASRMVLPAPPSPAAVVEGKAIVFARRDVRIGETRGWLDDPGLADIPHPGEQIRRGHPICTVFAQAGDADACYGLLVERAGLVYRAAESRKRGAA